MRLVCLLATLMITALGTGSAGAAPLSEPRLHVAPGGAAGPQVALTLDACMGAVDQRILDVLVRENVPATIFVTARWLQNNSDAARVLLSRPDLFEIEDHGANHVPAVIGVEKPYGIAPAGSVEAVVAEVAGGADAIVASGFPAPVWYRGATALYTADAEELIGSMGYRVAGYSLNADLGASASAEVAARRLKAAQDGDVIIAHINQPNRPAGAGIAEGIASLKQRGVRFLKLQDTVAISDRRP